MDSTFSIPYWLSLEAALVLATVADFEAHLIYDREIYADHLFISTRWAVLRAILKRGTSRSRILVLEKQQIQNRLLLYLRQTQKLVIN